MINPFPVVSADFRKSLPGILAVIVLIAFAVALGVAVSTQERALRKGSARAADPFDLIVGAPGSPTQLVLTTVYLQPHALPLIPADVLNNLQGEAGVEWVSPVAFGDFYQGHPVVGATTAFLSQGGRNAPGEGRLFQRSSEAVVGIDVSLRLGESFQPVHGAASPLQADAGFGNHEASLTVVGRMARLGSPWDRAIVVPVEAVWELHGLGKGHTPVPEGHHDEHEDSKIGPPWKEEEMAASPAVVVKPRTVSDAYRLRNKYRTGGTMALFPAEVLVELYATMGDIRDILAVISVLTQVLVIGAILLAVFASLQIKRKQLAVLRALGASQGYVFTVVWIHVTVMILLGTAVGFCLGWFGAWCLSYFFAGKTGLFLPVAPAFKEIVMALALVILGSVLALVPSFAVYRQSVSKALRS
jgi:putative ABC transport system permease protein